MDLFVPADATLFVITMQTPTGFRAKRMEIRSTSRESVAALLSRIHAVVGSEVAPDRTVMLLNAGLIGEVFKAVRNSEALLPETSSRSLRSRAVERACRYIDKHLTKPISLGELSRYSGVGTRTLEYSFRQFYNTTPIGFVKSARLTRTHAALMLPSALTTSINKIARRAGFTHMGQYCQDYRALFGESPSMTLQKVRRKERLTIEGPLAENAIMDP